MRVRTPGLFSTRIDRTCLRPVRSPPAASSSSRLRHLLRPRLAHDRHPTMSRAAWPGAIIGYTFSSWRDADVDEHRPVRRQRAADVVDERRLVLEPQARRPVGLRELDEVRVLAHVHVGVAAVPEQLLPLADHAQVAVVHDEDLDADALLGARRQLLHVHLHRAVAGDADDLLVGAADLRAHRRGQAEAHRAQAAAVDPAARPVEVEVLRRPHLVLADVGGDDRVAARRLVDRLDHALRADLGVGASPRSAAGACPASRGSAATTPRAASRSASSARYSRTSLRQDVLGVAHDRDVRRDVLGDLGRVDVDVDELRARGELAAACR